VRDQRTQMQCHGHDQRVQHGLTVFELAIALSAALFNLVRLCRAGVAVSLERLLQLREARGLELFE
jgi:hypothetical protein